MMDYGDKTPPPMPGAIPSYEQSRHISGAISLPLPQQQQQQSPESFFQMWWKALVGISAGMATVCAVLYFIAKQFFVTREEWNSQIPEFKQQTDRMAQIANDLKATNVTLGQVNESLNTIKIKLITMDAEKAAADKYKRKHDTQ